MISIENAFSQLKMFFFYTSIIPLQQKGKYFGKERV